MSDCFSYFGLGRPETHAQQKEARMELSWRRMGIGNQAKGTEVKTWPGARPGIVEELMEEHAMQR